MAKKPTYAELGKRVKELEKKAVEYQHAKESLEQSNIAMLDILESISDGFFSLDDRFIVTYFNRAAERLLGRSSWEVLGHNLFEAFPEAKGSIFEDKYTQGIKEKIPISFETYFDVGPYENWYEVRIYPREDGISVYFRVITERKRAEEEQKKLQVRLQQAEKMKAIATLARGIANDFNNLLSIIQGNASLVLFDMDASHPYCESLKTIERQAQRGSALSAQLLGYARHGRYEVKPIDLNRLVKETSEALGSTRKKITVHRRLADDLFVLEGDRAQLQQVLWNLYVNAAEAMPGGGDLTLITANLTHRDVEDKLHDPKPGKYVLLKVADTGTGMDEKTTGRIFEPFFTTKEAAGRAGLGLAAAYGIIESHGGNIDVESETGRGTTFNIYLPASQEQLTQDETLSDELLKGTETILLADDEAMFVEVGQQMLEVMGYKVFVATGGKEAVEVYEAKKNEIDLVILDMIMPDMGGGETYARLKEINPDIKVLLSTGLGVEGQASEILNSGCDGFIQKPFTLKELSHSIRQVLDI